MPIKYEVLAGTGGVTFGDRSFLTRSGFLKTDLKKKRLLSYAKNVTSPADAKRLGRLGKQKMLLEMAALSDWAKVQELASRTGGPSTPAPFEDQKASTVEALAKWGYVVSAESLNAFAESDDVLKAAAAAIVAAEKAKQTPEKNKGTLKTNECIRLGHALLSPKLRTALTAIGMGLNRDQLDAKYDPWEVVAAFFNDKSNVWQTLDMLYDPNTFRPATKEALKKAWSTIKCELTKVFARWLASGQQGTADLDGNLTFEDHITASWAFSNPDKMKPIGDFTKNSRYKPAVLGYFYRLFEKEPSLQPLAMRLADGGLDNDGTTDPKMFLPRKRKTQEDDARGKEKKRRVYATKADKKRRSEVVNNELVANIQAESRRAMSEEVAQFAKLRNDPSLDATSKAIIERRFKKLMRKLSKMNDIDSESEDDN